MKPRIYSFGHGWAIEIPHETEMNGIPVDAIHWKGRFEECIEHLDSVMPELVMRSWREQCLIRRIGLQEIGRA